MSKVEVYEVIRALAGTPEGNREFDAWVEMVMYPNRHYIFIDGTYYRGKVVPRRNLIKCAKNYTTSVDAAISLFPRERWEYDIRMTRKFGEVVIKTDQQGYSCRAPTAALGICYLLMKIADKEDYRKDRSGPGIFSVFFSERDYIKEKMRDTAIRNEGREMKQKYKRQAAKLQRFLGK